MKLSRAIELAITSNMYSGASPYMCIALKRINHEEHTKSVHDMVMSLLPTNTHFYRSTPLANVLFEVGLLNINEKTLREQFLYTKQLYCWWVFDLKRKGL